MPHSRKRHLLPLIIKKLSFSPVVTIQGARQTGKSFLARELLPEDIKNFAYATFDKKQDRVFATDNPESFIKKFGDVKPLIIDEAQKVPDIFDAIKYEVDQNRVPGRFLLLGSTEFSKMSLIRESLTGRMSRVRLFPLNLAETMQEKVNPSRSPLLLNEKPRFTREQSLLYLNRGGMPGLFAVRNEAERHALMNDWISLTVNRDILTFTKASTDPELCQNILEKIATLDEPDASNIARVLKVDARKIKTHLAMLSELFVIHSLKPHQLSTGKPHYFLCDVGLAGFLGADFERQLYTWLLLEQFSQRSYRDDYQHTLSYYRNTKGSLIHLIVSDKKEELYALKLWAKEGITQRDLELLKSFRIKAPNAKLMGLGSGRQSFHSDKIEIYPWEAIA